MMPDRYPIFFRMLTLALLSAIVVLVVIRWRMAVVWQDLEPTFHYYRSQQDLLSPEYTFDWALENSKLMEEFYASYQGPREWPLPLWAACWNEQGYLDFTSPAWNELPHFAKKEYLKTYQRWYAHALDLPVEKITFVEKVRFLFVLIPPGKYWRGSPSDEPDHQPGETRHAVTIEAFWMSPFEITQRQWGKVTGEKNWRGKGDLPVVEVSWHEVKERFLAKLPRQFALPTEAQWEYAARAGEMGAFLTAKRRRNIKHHVVGGRVRSQPGNYPLAPVGSGLANGFGLYNMMGNAMEWCQDWYAPYPDHPLSNPYGPSVGKRKVVRGLSCSTVLDPRLWRYAFRNRFPPSRKGIVGFRVTLQVRQDE